MTTTSRMTTSRCTRCQALAFAADLEYGHCQACTRAAANEPLMGQCRTCLRIDVRLDATGDCDPCTVRFESAAAGRAWLSNR